MAGPHGYVKFIAPPPEYAHRVFNRGSDRSATLINNAQASSDTGGIQPQETGRLGLRICC